MKMTTTVKATMVIFAACLALGALATEPSISGVTVRQRWPWSRLVDIDYVLSCEPLERVDIAVIAYNGSEPLSLPDGSLSGDLYGVSQGIKRIVWDPMKTAYTNEALTRFRVDLAPAPIPLYMIVDLTKEAETEGQIEYVYETDLAGGAYGTVETNPVNGVSSIVWTGVTNDIAYKTDKLILRRVPCGSFTIGEDAGAKEVTLTRDFYMGVFEVTQNQWEHIMGNRPSNFRDPISYPARPVENVSYNDIRGATNDTPAINWPLTGCYVLPGTFMGRLRNRTGVGGFDLPTEAQWEYACRADTMTVFNDGDQAANVKDDNRYTNTWLNVLGRYRFNGGFIDGTGAPSPYCGATNGTAVVGSYKANGWGLYDAHGNVMEWCLDWYEMSLRGGEDPEGAESGASRILRNASWYYSADSCRSAFRSSIGIPSNKNWSWGFRCVRNLP
jgi:formylglycine-generating enzyme required for sulfatase activity